jgi:hypothetical protein
MDGKLAAGPKKNWYDKEAWMVPQEDAGKEGK